MTENSKKFTESMITLQNRKCLSLTGVEKVLSSNENQICLIVCSNSLTINGSELSVQKLDVENGMVKIEGTINSIKYDEKKENFLKRIFK